MHADPRSTEQLYGVKPASVIVPAAITATCVAKRWKPPTEQLLTVSTPLPGFFASRRLRHRQPFHSFLWLELDRVRSDTITYTITKLLPILRLCKFPCGPRFILPIKQTGCKIAGRWSFRNQEESHESGRFTTKASATSRKMAAFRYYTVHGKRFTRCKSVLFSWRTRERRWCVMNGTTDFPANDGKLCCRIGINVAVVVLTKINCWFSRVYQEIIG